MVGKWYPRNLPWTWTNTDTIPLISWIIISHCGYLKTDWTFQLTGLHSPPGWTYFWQALMVWWVGTWQVVWSACQSGTGVGWVLVCGFLGPPSAGFELSSFVFSFYRWPESVDGWIQTCQIPASGEHLGYWNNPNNPVHCFSLSYLQCEKK